MVLDLTPEQEAHLNQIAQHEGKNPEQLLIETAFHLMQYDDQTREIIRERIREADLGIFIEEKEMDERVRKMLSSE